MPKKTKSKMKEAESPVAEQDICSRCGLMEEEWSANKGKGFLFQGETYCCEGCAEDTGCTCENDRDAGEN